MANPEHVELLREGTNAISAWRAQNPDEPLDLSGAHLPNLDLQGAPLGDANFERASLVECELAGADLRGAFLTGVDLRGANLSRVTGHGLIAQEADIRRANLSEADFRAANLSETDLRTSNLSETDLRAVNLSHADLRRADLRRSDLRRGNLTDVNLQDAFLQDAQLNETQLVNVNLTRACVHGVDFENAICSGTLWNDVDLAETSHLDSIIHQGPSSVGVDTIYLSRGRLPAAFLRGCGLNESFIANVPSLAYKALHFHPVLILFVEADREKAKHLAESLEKRGVRCWKDVITGEELKSREFYRYRRGHKLLFCISENWLARPEAEQTLHTAQMLEEKATSEQGLSLRTWVSVDLDGVLSDPQASPMAEAHRERLVGAFPPEFSTNGQFEQQLDNVLAALTIHAGADTSATLVDQALLQIRQMIGHSQQLQNGYRKLRRNDGAKNVWFDYRGRERRSYHIRQLVRGRLMEWDTAPVMVDRGQDFCFFCFAGAMGAQNRPPSLGFTLLVNGEPTVPFNLARDERAWHSPDHTVTLLYCPHWLSRDDSSGFFYVAILRDRLKAGFPCRLGVLVRGQDSPRWFALFPEALAVEAQAEMGEMSPR